MLRAAWRANSRSTIELFAPSTGREPAHGLYIEQTA